MTSIPRPFSSPSRLSVPVLGLITLTQAACSFGPVRTRVPAAEPRVAHHSAEDLRATCGHMDRFRAVLVESTDGERRQALTRWSPPEPPSAQDHPWVVDAARQYLAHCGLAETVELTRPLVSFRTVSALESAADGASFAEMASFLSDWSAGAGLTFRTVGENDAWEVALGSGPRSVAFVMHADVVPVDDTSAEERRSEPAELPAGWSSPPFSAEVRGGRLYGRGTEDDKAPIAAVLVVLRTLARAGLLPSGQILAVMGTGEEHDWDGMRRYAQTEPHARSVVSIDASFPVVVAEAGFVAFRIAADASAPRRRGPRARAVDAHAGLFLTQVPGEASLTLEPGLRESALLLHARAREAVAAEIGARGPGPFRLEASLDGEHVTITAHGQAVHSSEADEGHNALWALAAVASRLDLEAGGIQRILRLVHDKLDGDHWGERLGLSYEHALMGKLLVSPTMLRVEAGKAILSINMRRPAGVTATDFEARLDALIERLRTELGHDLHDAGERYVGEAAMADTSGPLVPTLLDIFREHTGDLDAAPITIRGGTYARLFDGAVSFGPSMPGRPYRGHAPDEYIELHALDGLVQMLFEAAVRLDALDSDRALQPLRSLPSLTPVHPRTPTPTPTQTPAFQTGRRSD